MIPAGKAVDIPDVTEQAGGAGRADAVQLLQGAAGGRNELGQLDVGGFDLFVDDGQFGDELCGELSAGAPDDVAWPHRIE